MNKIQAEITKLEADGDRHVIDNLFLRLLYEKQQKLGKNPSPEMAEAAYDQAQAELLQLLQNRRRSVMENSGFDETAEKNLGIIQKVFRDLKILYRGYLHSIGIYAFSFALNVGNKSFLIRIYLEPNTQTCQINAVHPSRTDTEQLDTLCTSMEERNWNSCNGTLQYDAFYNEFFYHHSFSVRNGLQEDDFKAKLQATIEAIYQSCGIIDQPHKELQRENAEQTQRLPLIPEQYI